MEVEPNQMSKSELILKLKKSIQLDKIEQSDILKLTNVFLNIEEANEFNSTSANCLILLLCIRGKYREAGLRELKYKNRRLYTDIAESTQIFLVSRKLIKYPFCDIYDHIYFFLRSNSFDVNVIAAAFLIIYEKQQAIFISNFFSIIKKSTLKKLLGVHLKGDEINIYVKKYYWVLENEFITTKRLEDNNYNLQDLSFINSSTVFLENLTKSNNSIKLSLN